MLAHGGAAQTLADGGGTRACLRRWRHLVSSPERRGRGVLLTLLVAVACVAAAAAAAVLFVRDPTAAASTPGGPPRPWTETPDGFFLYTPLPALRLVPGRGYAEFPPHVRRLWIDVGVYQRTDFWAALEKYPRATRDVAVWGLEPNARHVAAHPPHPAVTLINAAAADVEGVAAMRMWSPTGASLHALGPAHSRYLSDAERNPLTVRTEQVVVLRLDTLLRLVPSAPPDAQVRVEYLKVDAQGADLRVLRGAGAALARVESVTAECQDLPNASDPRLFYQDACLVHELRAFMASHGYTRQSCALQNADIAEYNCHFGRTDAAHDRALRLFEHEAL